jgi:hypothetical protein
MVAETVLSWASVELNEPVATPLALVGLGCVIVLPPPVADRMTVAPSIGLPEASRAVTVTVAVLDPVLAVITAGAAVTVDWLAEIEPALTVNGVLVAGARAPLDAWSV